MDKLKQEVLSAFPERVHDRRKWLAAYSGVRDKVVVQILARGNSTRVPGKNIKMLGGKPLLAYTIEIAKRLEVDRVIVNTDSPEIKAVAEEYGAEVPFLRPEFLSSSTSPPGYASLYSICHLMAEDYPLDVMIDMFPTTPFRNLDVMKGFLEKTKQYGYCSSCAPVDMNASFYADESGKVLTRRIGVDNAFYFKMVSNFIGLKIDAYHHVVQNYQMLTNPVELIDIDTPSDFELAEYILDNNLYEFGCSI